MGIIDIDGCTTFGDDGAFQSATDGLQPREMRQQAFHVAATRHHNASGDKRVCGLISANQRQFHFVHVTLNSQLKRLAKLRGFAREQLHTLALFAHGNHPQFAFARPCNDLVRPDIICPDYRAAIFIDDLVE